MGQMGHLFKKRKAVSFRGTAMLSLTVIVIPLFIAVIIFDSYTVSIQPMEGITVENGQARFTLPACSVVEITLA